MFLNHIDAFPWYMSMYLPQDRRERELVELRAFLGTSLHWNLCPSFGFPRLAKPIYCLDRGLFNPFPNYMQRIDTSRPIQLVATMTRDYDLTSPPHSAAAAVASTPSVNVSVPYSSIPPMKRQSLPELLGPSWRKRKYR